MDEALFTQLDDYLKGKLSEAERLKIQKRIENEEEVAAQLAMLRLEKELGQFMVEEELDSKMEQWNKERATRRKEEINGLSANKTVQPKTNYTSWIIIGLLLILIALMAYFIWGPKNTAVPEVSQPEKIVIPEAETPSNRDTDTPDSQNAQPAQDNTSQPEQKPAEQPRRNRPIADADTPKENETQLLALAEVKSFNAVESMSFRAPSEPEPDEPAIIRATRLIQENRLEEAKAILQDIPVADIDQHLNAQQLLGYIYFDQEDYDAAIQIFEELIAANYIDLETMQWYLALSYLIKGNEKQGLDIIRGLADGEVEQTIKEKAQAFLGKMK